MYKKQFLLTKEKTFKFNWPKTEIGSYNLFHHPDLEYSFARMNHSEIHLLGSIFDYENPQLINKDIIKNLVCSDTVQELFLKISKNSGEYVLIYKRNDDIIILNDACAQSEIYYDDQFCCFSTQPKLIAEVINTVPHDDPDAIDFYTSDIFRDKCLFVGDTSHVKNIKHLLPNHYIEINKKVISRFYPVKPISALPLDEVAKRASTMIKGYIKAISLRHDIVIAVTGGYDSRVLFLASLGTKSKYYVLKHPAMTSSHYDILIPQKLTSLYKKEFHVLPDDLKIKNDYYKDNINSIDFPRLFNLANDSFENHVFISGNISEIARNYYGYHKYVSGEDLSFLSGYSIHKYPSRQYDIYLKTNKPLFENLGYNLLDMFYWEEKMGNWAAKSKTEANALGKTIFSPYNSRDLLTLLLSVKRKYRDSHYNQLYDRIIFYLSDNNKKVQKLPINPCKKQWIIRIMKKLKIYNFYRNVGLRTRKLQI